MAGTILPHIVHRDHIGVREAGGRLGSAVEVLDELGVSGQAVVQNLDRHQAAQRHILGLVDH